MTNVNKIGIVGLGLIGGSVALALNARYRLVGVDDNVETRAYCEKNGIVAETGGLDALKGCDVVFVCVPLDILEETIGKVYHVVGESAIITDVGSVKGILSSCKGRIVGGHPMAGTEKNGITAAKAHLFENAYYCVVPYAQTLPQDEETVLQLIAEDLHAKPVRLSAEEHDREIARLSHLPHLAAYTLASLLTGGGDAAIAGTGFCDTTRIASSSPDFWAAVVRLNRENVLCEMKSYREAFARLETFIEQGDYASVREFFANAKEKRDKLTNRRAYKSEYLIDVDVRDEVGSIGRISSLLADGGVNLSNIRILNSREGLGGALRLEIADETGYRKALALLNAAQKKENILSLEEKNKCGF